MNLSSPFEFSAIGESSVMKPILEQSGGIMDRILAFDKDIQISIEERDVIQMH